jgi:tRNA-dihydrouridine synthase C
VDLNFGCPAKVVNRHGGGAALLDEPELMHRILREVCRTVPAGTVVSAKMRLGTQDDARAVECAQALAEGGAMELVVHGRTKLQGYRPPAYWDRIGAIREAVAVPVVANGEIWTVDDARRCQAESGCTDLMLGRGMVCDPGLALAVRAAVAGEGAEAPVGLDWAALQPLLAVFWDRVRQHIVPRHQAGRLKQWLNLLRRRHPEAEAAYQAWRGETDGRRIALALLGPEGAGPGGEGRTAGARYTAGSLPSGGAFVPTHSPRHVPVFQVPATSVFELKSAALTVLALQLKTPDLASLAEALAARYGATPGLFEHEPLCVDLSLLRDEAELPDFEGLVALLRRHGFNPMAARGGNPEQMAAALTPAWPRPRCEPAAPRGRRPWPSLPPPRRRPRGGRPGPGRAAAGRAGRGPHAGPGRRSRGPAPRRPSPPRRRPLRPRRPPSSSTSRCARASRSMPVGPT